MRFYVADHTMEVGEMLNGNSGRDLTSRFRILRQRLKKPTDLSASISNGVNFGSTGGRTVYFEPKDFIVGTIVHIFGRPVVVTSCDQFTRQYYTNVMQASQPANMQVCWDPKAAAIAAAVPGGGQKKKTSPFPKF